VKSKLPNGSIAFFVGFALLMVAFGLAVLTDLLHVPEIRYYAVGVGAVAVLAFVIWAIQMMPRFE
jgi:bacteriorhodopsin